VLVPESTAPLPGGDGIGDPRGGRIRRACRRCSSTLDEGEQVAIPSRRRAATAPAGHQRRGPRVDLGALTSGLVTGLREGVEAGLIVSIVITYLIRTGTH